MTTTAEALREAKTLFVGGKWHGASDTYERFLPSDLSRSSGVFAKASAADVVAAYAAAAAAAPGWAATPAPARAEVLRRAADLIVERADEGARRLTDDMGKAARDAKAEVIRSAQILRWFAGEIQQASGETYPSADRQTFLMTIEQPLGVVCAITPWNFPWAIPTWKLAPALGFGNAVVWKPAAAASGSAVMLAEVLSEAGLPDGVLNLITGGGGSLSEALTGDPRLAALTFTGSAGVGTRLREAVADRNVKVQLELGGKNPAIVLADADLDDAATQIARGAMLATGQRCTATSRVYVEREAAAELCDLLVRKTEELAVGDPYEAATDVGPLASEEQRQTIGHYLDLAREEGVEVLTGGSLVEGCYVEPTILTGVSPDSALVREEIFGPVLVVEEVDGFEAALAAANDTEFGLSSAVFTTDLKRAFEFVRATESGLVHVNRETAGVEPHVPFGGVKGSSSMAREQGTAARAFFTTTKTVYVRTP
jgi:aldehyde dehydrogenase (NAD+)